MRCGYCGSKNHTERHCPKTAGGQAERRGLRCGYCGRGGHKAAACPKITSAHVRADDDHVRDWRR